MTDPLRTTLQDSLGSAYALKDELGGGGMSRVFIAREEALGRDVVVKVLAPDLAEGLSVERFAREIRLAAALQDPHIVPVHSAGSTAEGVPWYTMPFVEGASLRNRLDTGLVPRAEAVRLLRDVAQALAYAHARGIVHRDIKPENILLSNGSAVVTDFGLAKALHVARTQADAPDAPRGITRTGMSLGTPAYMAPEQAAGDPDTDQRADLYAWGMVAYEALAGRHPFADRLLPQQMLAAQIVDMPVPLEQVATGLAPTLSALEMQCLAKDAAARPRSATEILHVLDAMTQSSAEARVAAPRPRRRVLIAAASVTVVAALALAWRGGALRRDSVAADKPSEGPVMMAVLPFEHAGPADQQPFTDGLTDAVTAKLGALSSLLVIDRRSAATYRGTTKSTQQIGTELGVRYLLEGVVRSAKDGAGVWRARVTPTLVDVKSGAIKWTGEPADVTLDDPFTAQGSIATDVAEAMEVAVSPAERVALRRRFSDNPQAYAAYQRAQSLADEAAKLLDADSDEWQARVARDLELAVALDSSFSIAWGSLANRRFFQAAAAPGDSSAARRAREASRIALTRAPDEPGVQLAAARVAIVIDHDTASALQFVDAAMRLAPNDAAILARASDFFRGTNDDLATKLTARAAILDPRSASVLVRAAYDNMFQRKFGEVGRIGEAILALDSTDERGWTQVFLAQAMRGDTTTMRRTAERMLLSIPRPGVNLASWALLVDPAMRRRYLSRSGSERQISSVSDSIQDIDNRMIAALLLRDTLRARAHAETLIAFALKANARRHLAPYIRVGIAHAQAIAGMNADASTTLSSAIQEARGAGTEQYPARELQADDVAGVYGLLGNPSEAVRWLEAGLKSTYTMRWFAVYPRLDALRRTPEYREFVRKHPQ